METPQADNTKWWVLLAVGLGSLLTAMSASAVNMALPLVGREFHKSVAELQWVVTIYLLGVSATLLSFGRLGDLRGHRPVYLWGFVAFVAGSLLSGFARDTSTLIAFRACQAIGAAMLFANGPAILVGSFPPSERGRSLGLQGTLTYIGLSIGPPLGGWLAGAFGWRWVFFVNVPLGLLGLLPALRWVPKGAPRQGEERFDWAGAATFTLGLTALLLALGQGPDWGWGSPFVLGGLAIAVLLLVAFVLIERRRPSPMLDLSLFASPVFSATTLSASLNYICVYAILFLLPFYLLEARALPPGPAGLVLTAQPIVMAVVAPIAGSLSDRIGTRWPAAVGMAVLGLGLFLLSRLGPDTSLWQVAGALAVAGLGTGTFVSPNNSALMGAAPRHRQGIAGGVLATARNVGMMLGVALATAVYATSLAGQHGAQGAMFRAIDASFLVIVAAAVLGAITSLAKPTGDGR